MLDRSFYLRSPALVARELIGKSLVRMIDGGQVGGVIVETEAYLHTGDPASHSHRGPTPRNRAMFGPAGTLYVYAIHNQHCLNAVTECEGVGSAVLIRAIEPVWGLDQMIAARGKPDPRLLCRGPGMLCQSLSVDRRLDGCDLCQAGEIQVFESACGKDFSIRATPRIGISRATDLPLRFFVDGNRYVSGLARDHTKPPASLALPSF